MGHKMESLGRQGGEGVSVRLHGNRTKNQYIAKEWEDEVSLVLEITKSPLHLPQAFLTKFSLS